MTENMSIRSTEVVALAGGKGSRANSAETGIPKVLYEINKKPLLGYIIDTVEELGIYPIVVTGFLEEKITERFGDRARWVTQNLEELPGTAGAVKTALSEIRKDVENVIIVPGDHGYIYSKKNYQELQKIHRESEDDVTIVAFNVSDPKGYGRVMLDEHGQVMGIVEQKHVTTEQSKIDLINSGTMIIRRDVIDELINAIERNPSTGEFYLTDIIEEARERGMGVGVYVPTDITFRDGINTMEQLAYENNQSDYNQTNI